MIIGDAATAAFAHRNSTGMSIKRFTAKPPFLPCSEPPYRAPIRPVRLVRTDRKQPCHQALPSAPMNSRRPMWVAMRPSRRGHAQQRYHAFIAWSADSSRWEDDLVSVRLSSNVLEADIPFPSPVPLSNQCAAAKSISPKCRRRSFETAHAKRACSSA